MNLNVVYPAKNIKRNLRRNAIIWAKYPFFLAAIACVTVNAILGGAWWSAIVLWSEWLVWQFFFSPTLIEHNRTSIAVKTSINVTALIVVIYLVYPAWPGIEVASLVVVGGLITTSALFFSNVSKQKQNFFPLIVFLLISLVFGIVAYIFRSDKPLGWAMIVAIALSLAIFLSTIIILKINIWRELKKRFMV